MNDIFNSLGKNPVALAVVCLVLGIVADQVINDVRGRFRFAKELKENGYINVSGTWVAAWQTSINGVEKHNLENVRLIQRGQTVLINNTEKAPLCDGGYFWQGQLRFIQGRSLMGWYFPTKDENNSSRGIMYFTYFSQRKVFFGKWVGSAYDGDLQSGMAVIAVDKEQALLELTSLIEMHPAKVGIIGYAFGPSSASRT